MATDYEDKLSSARTCCVCGREFNPEADYLSALFEEGEQFLRRDYCGDCWQGPPEGSFSYWRGRMPAKEERPQRFVDDRDLVDLLARLADVTEPRQTAFRYLLGLLLVRKRVLKLLPSGPGRGEPMLLEEPGGGARYEVPAPRISADELAQVSAQMGAVLRVDTEPQRTETKEGGKGV